MAFWNTTRLRSECERKRLIEPYREERALRSAYELGVGPEAFITSKTGDTTHLEAGCKVTIPPGQFGLLITNETVYVPDTAIAFISIRAKIKFQGLVNVSGFHVDPGYRGRLKFAVYNAGSKDIVLDQDERVFMIWYADLDAVAPDPYPSRDVPASVITSEDVGRIKGDVASPAELKKQIDELKVDLEKKVNSGEQSILINRAILLVIVSTGMALILTTFVKPHFDGSRTSAAPAARTLTPGMTLPEGQPQEGVPSPTSSGELFAPRDLGFYILGAGGIAALGNILAALISRRRPN